jgi:hypothetical protein
VLTCFPPLFPSPLARLSFGSPAARLRYQNRGTLHSSITITITPAHPHSHILTVYHQLQLRLGARMAAMGSILNAVIYPQRVAACSLVSLERGPCHAGPFSRLSSLVPSSSANLSQPPASASHVTHNHAPGVASSLSHRTNEVHDNAFIGLQATPPFSQNCTPSAHEFSVPTAGVRLLQTMDAVCGP